MMVNYDREFLCLMQAMNLTGDRHLHIGSTAEGDYFARVVELESGFEPLAQAEGTLLQAMQECVKKLEERERSGTGRA